MARPASTSGKKVKAATYGIDVSAANAGKEGSIVDPADLEKFMRENIKVANKRNNLGEAVVVGREGPNKVTVTVKSGTALAKRYVKVRGPPRTGAARRAERMLPRSRGAGAHELALTHPPALPSLPAVPHEEVSMRGRLLMRVANYEATSALRRAVPRAPC